MGSFKFCRAGAARDIYNKRLFYGRVVENPQKRVDMVFFINLNLLTMAKKFKQIVVFAIAVFAVAVNANGQPPCSSTGTPVSCLITGFPIGMDPISGGEMCADFHITFICDPTTCNIIITDSITLYECGVPLAGLILGQNYLTYQFDGIGTYSSTGVRNWSFSLMGWWPIGNPWPTFTIITASGSEITCDLEAIVRGVPPGVMPSFPGGHPSLANDPAFQACLAGLGCP